MCRIVVVNKNNRAHFAGYLRDMHAQRYAIYAEERGWAALKNPLKLDIDEYDTSLATWLLALSDDGEVLGSIRLLPTDCNTLIGDHYRQLASVIEVPDDPNVWEITRYYVKDKDRKAPDGHDIKRHLIIGMLEYAFMNQTKALIVVADTGFLRLLEMFKWPYEVMGLPQKYEEGECVGIYIHLNSEMIENHRALVNFWNDSLVLDGENHFRPRTGNFVAEHTRELMTFASSNRELIKPLTVLLERLQSPDPNIAERAKSDLEVLMLEFSEHTPISSHQHPVYSQMALN